MEKRDQARKLWEDSGGAMFLKDIASQLGVSEGTVRSWKNRYGWGKNDCNVATLRNDATQRERQRKRQSQVNRSAAEDIENNEELNEREKDFCIAFVHAPNASQAAMKIGRYTTYGAARTAAYEMMKKPAVQEEIKRLRALKRKAILAEADDIIEMHMRIAFAEMDAFVEWGQEEVPVMTMYGPLEVINPVTGVKETVTKMVNAIRFKEHDQVDGSVISQVKMGRDGASVKLVDKQKSLDFLERYFLLNPLDKHKKAYDDKRLALEEREVKIHEDKLHGVSADIEVIKAGLKDLIGIINAPVPDRRLEDE